MRVMVAGSRGWSDAVTIGRALQDHVAHLPEPRTLVYAACDPAGALAHQEWRQIGLGRVEQYPHPKSILSRGVGLLLAFAHPCRDARCLGAKSHDEHYIGAIITEAKATRTSVVVHRRSR